MSPKKQRSRKSANTLDQPPGMQDSISVGRTIGQCHVADSASSACPSSRKSKYKHIVFLECCPPVGFPMIPHYEICPKLLASAPELLLAQLEPAAQTTSPAPALQYTTGGYRPPRKHMCCCSISQHMFSIRDVCPCLIIKRMCSVSDKRHVFPFDKKAYGLLLPYLMSSTALYRRRCEYVSWWWVVSW